MAKTVIVIGAGFGGLAVAAILAKRGFQVKVFEKNARAGGRAAIIENNGFKFDSGPSWYMMPEAFERFFAIFDKKPEDFYHLVKLNPTYRAFFDNAAFDISTDIPKMLELFEKLEAGSSLKFTRILKEAKYIYHTAIKEILYRDPSFQDFLQPKLILKFLQKNLFQSYDQFIKKNFHNEKIRRILSWHTIFLGGTPYNVPALYILMLYADFKLGTFFPEKGFYSVVEALVKIATDQGVEFHYQEAVETITIKNKLATSVKTNTTEYQADLIISNADYYHTEQSLLPASFRSYSADYWPKKVFSPSVLLIFVGTKKKFPQLLHHNYYFSNEAAEHFKTIDQRTAWPENPSFYISVRSKDDESAAPKNGEAIMFLVPIANGLEDTEAERQHLKTYLYQKISKILGEDFSKAIVHEKITSLAEQITDFHAFNGNAFGLANTLWQTGIFRPHNQSNKLKNLFFTGTTTAPGIGVPLALISGEVTATKICKIYE